MLKIILAGILGVPSLLLAAVVAPIVGVLAIPSLLLLLFQKEEQEDATTSTTTVIPDHVIVVGGSSGIGLAIARIAASQRKVPKVTILARDPTKLEAARKQIEEDAKAASSPSQVRAVSVSVTDYESLQKVAGQILCADSDKEGGKKTPTERTVLFCCAGISYTTEFESVPVDVYGRLVETNQLGAMYVVRAFLPYLQKGCIVLCASGAGQLGMYGYSVYSPTKFALRGLAETLHMELIRSRPGLSVQIAFPLDTATPGFEMEREMMPEITKILNASGGVAKAEE
jgi:3-dehydrosphinganine reductase